MILKKSFIVNLRTEVPQTACAIGCFRDDTRVDFQTLTRDGTDDLKVILRHPGIVINFSCGEGLVSIGSEVLGQRDVIFQSSDIPRWSLIVINTAVRGSQAIHDAGAGRVAYRSLAMGIGEKHTAFCQTIDIRGFGLRMTVEASDPIVEVIDSDKQDVGLISGEWGAEGRDEKKESRAKAQRRKVGLSFQHR